MSRSEERGDGRRHSGEATRQKRAECRRARAWIEDEASGALGAREVALLLRHAESCADCNARRGRSGRLVRDLALTFASVPAMDVRRRVMEQVLAEAQAASRRGRVGWRPFWIGMAASFSTVCLLALQARRAAAALPGEALAESHLLLRLGFGGWTALSSTVAALSTLALGLVDAAVHILISTATSVFAARHAALWLVALIFVASAVPVVRVLRPGRHVSPLRMLMAAWIVLHLGAGVFAAQDVPSPPDPPGIGEGRGDPGRGSIQGEITIDLHDDGVEGIDPDDPEAHITGQVKVNVVQNVTIEEGEVHNDDLVVVGGTAVIRGEVRGDVVVVGGKLDLNGRVKGSAVAFMTDTTIGDEARVGGDLVHLGGLFEASPEAKVGGETFHADLPGLAFGVGAREVADGAFHVVYLIRLLMFAILFWTMLIIVCVAPGRITSIGEALGHHWGRAIMLGLLAYAATCVLGFIFLILSLLLIGLPLLAMLGFAWLVVEAMGLAAILWLLGDRVVRNLFRSELAPALAFLVGFAIYLPTQMIPFHWGVPWMVMAILGGALHICATVLAVGLTLATQFENSRLGFRKSTPPPPPPSPAG